MTPHALQFLPEASARALACLLVCSLAHGQPVMPGFEEADTDADGVLGIAEARAVFPLLEFIDGDMDGLLSIKEATDALPDFLLGNDSHEDENRLVGATEYQLLSEQYAMATEAAGGASAD